MYGVIKGSYQSLDGTKVRVASCTRPLSVNVDPLGRPDISRYGLRRPDVITAAEQDVVYVTSDQSYNRQMHICGPATDRGMRLAAARVRCKKMTNKYCICDMYDEIIV